MALASFRTNLAERIVSGVHLANVSTASSAWVQAPERGWIVEAGSALHSAISVADATITVYVNGTATQLSWTITASGSAAGDTDKDTAPALGTGHHVVPGDSIEFRSDGGSTDAAALNCYCIIRRS